MLSRALYVCLLSFVFCLLSLATLFFAGAARSVESDRLQDFARPTHIVFPENSPYSPQIAALGKMLFFDPRLSGAQDLSCASCHNPSFGWEKPVSLAVGAMNVALPRHAPTLENLAEVPYLQWDGSAETLEDQARIPITRERAMNGNMDDVMARLSSVYQYRQHFDAAFPTSGLTEENLLRALATYQRTIQSAWSPFDFWVAGDEDVVSDAARRGFELFTGKARCAVCHAGWTFTNHRFYDTGVTGSDPGRAGVDGSEPAYRQAFKTPGLRNIALRAPYMHNGSLDSLSDVIDHYVSGGDSDANRPLDISPVSITSQQRNDLIAFLNSLTAIDPEISQPVLPAE